MSRDNETILDYLYDYSKDDIELWLMNQMDKEPPISLADEADQERS